MDTFDAVLFDAGDTLIRLRDSGEGLLHAAGARVGAGELAGAEVAAVWRRVLERSSTADELAKGRDLSSARHREVWTALYEAAGCERLAPGLSAELYRLTVDARSWEAFPDAVEVVRGVHERGLRIGIVSDTGFDLRPALVRLGLAAHLDTVVMSYELGICKPDPEPFLVAAGKLGADPARTLMVGDNPFTDSGAVGVGMHVLLLPKAPRTGPRGLRHVLALL